MARIEAQRYKRDGEWHSVSYEELGRTVSEIARGLIDLGIEPGDRVSLLCATRPEWTSCDFAISSAGAVVVPIYPTNSPGECEWVAGNSESVAIVCEDASQVAKIVEVRDNLPALRHVIVVDPSGDVADAIALDDLRERGRGRDEAELRQRREAVGEDDTYTIIYTSGTTGPPKGCVLSHRNYRQVVNMCEEQGVLEEGDLVYLFLPLAHAYALLVQLLAIDLGGSIAYFGRRPEADRARADGGPPDLPAVGAADLREDLHARHLQRRPRADQGRRRRRAQGARAAGRGPGGPRRAAGATTTRPTRRCSRTSAGRSAASSSRPTPAPRRSRRRSSSSSTPAACR